MRAVGACVSRKSPLFMRACRQDCTVVPSVSFRTLPRNSYDGAMKSRYSRPAIPLHERISCPGAGRPCAFEGKAELGSSLQLAMLAEVFETARDSFDIVHSHIDYWSFPFANLTRVPTVSTMHGRLDISDLHPVYGRFPQAAVVSISDSQRAPLAEMNWIATVHHGMPRDLLSFSERSGKYLAFIGRISPEKGIELPSRLPLRSGVPLKIAAKVDAVDREYFTEVIKPRINPPMIEYIGEIDDAQKSDFLGGALALLFTIDWPEPFGLAMIKLWRAARRSLHVRAERFPKS